MSRYKDLPFPDGAKYMRNVWGLCFKPIDEYDYWVDSFGNEALADCADFQLGEDSKIYLFVEDPKLVDFLTQISEQLYLYGAYNQINVCQMRARGTVTQEAIDSAEAESIRKRLRANISGRVDVLVHKLTKTEAEERFRIIKGGHLFCFHPEAYAYDTYERG